MGCKKAPVWNIRTNFGAYRENASPYQVKPTVRRHVTGMRRNFKILL